VRELVSLKTNLEAIEAMLYFWDATKDKEKVNEQFLNNLAELPVMKLVYDDEFTAESVRRILSGITNREPIRPANRKEGRFFNNNLWMLEDLSLTAEMAQPIKKLNLDALANELSQEFSQERKITVYFAPLHLEEVYVKPDALIINFFRLQPDFAGGVNVAGQPLLDYLTARLREMLG
jgi:hypothetical protein